MTKSAEPTLVIFFIPLPQALGLTHGSTFGFAEDGSSGLPNVPMKATPDMPPMPGFSAGSNFTSLRLWQVNSSMTGFLEQLDVAMKVVRVVTPFTPQVETASSRERPMPDAVITVIEAVTPLLDADADPISDALDHCLTRIQQVSTASGLVTGQSAKLVTREQLPLIIPMCQRNLDGDVWSNFSMYQLHSNDVVRYAPATLDEEGVSRLGHFLRATVRSEPLISYLDLRAEAERLLEREGDTRTSVIMLAASCEVLLDLLLLAMLWEDGSSAEVAADVFSNGNGIASRVKKLYAERIGGTWNLVQSGPVKNWLDSVADLRNRCVHGGYRPTPDRAEAAMSAADDLRLFIVERLKESKTARRFPLTASIFLSTQNGKSADEKDLLDWMAWRDDVTKLRHNRLST